MLSWQLYAYEPIVTIGKPTLNDILYSPDGRFLATLTHSYVELLDANTFAPIMRIDEVDGYKLAFSPDGSLLVISGSRTGIQCWDVDSQTLLATIPVQTEIVAFSPGGKYLAYADGDSVFLWDIVQKETVLELTEGELVSAIAFHPNDMILAVGIIGSTLTLWDVKAGEVLSHINTITPHSKIVRFNPDGTLLAVVTKDDAVRLFNVTTGDIHDNRVPQGTDVHDLGFTPDSQHLLVGEGDGYLRVIQLATLSEEKRPAVNRLPYPKSHNGNRLERLTFHPDGRKFASLINNSRICFWNAQNFSRLQTLYGWANDWAQAIYFPKLNRIITGIYTNVLHFWDATTGELLKTEEFYSTIWQLKPSSDGRNIAIDVEATNQIWDASTGKPRHVFQIHGYLGTETIEFSPSGKYLASNTFRGTFVWDVETGEEIKLLETGWSAFPLLMFSRNERQIMVIPPDEEKVVFWDIKTGQPIRKINYFGPIVRSENGSLLQARDKNDKELGIFQIASNKRSCQIFKLKPFLLNAGFYNVQFHPSGDILAIRYRGTNATSNQYNFYDSQTGELLNTLFIQDFRFVGKGDFMFLTNNKGELGLYRTREVLGAPISKQPSRWGELKQAQLLPNYPNPFNPETWIPYQLATDREVTIRIHNHLGETIRVLQPGVKSVGTYLAKSEAVHWDGRNEAGELVASGVYFYTLQAGDFTATRRMLMLK